MWNPFKKTTEVGLIKSTSIQLQIVLAMEEMIDSLNIQTLPMPKKQTLPVPDEVKALMNAGFVNHKKVKAFKDEQEKLNKDFNAEYEIYTAQSNSRIALQAALKFLLRARATYGPNTLLLPIDQFIQICKKYNLVCGTFDQYTGEIPADKLKEITRLKSIRPIHESLIKVNKIIKTGIGGSRSEREYEIFDQHFNKNFPFFREGSDLYFRNIRFLDGKEVRFFHMEFEYSKDSYFIAAPKKMMIGKVQEVYDPSKDPIIWGIRGNYVLIFTRWGEEADDEVIRRCEAFNQKLDAFATSLM